MELNIFDLQRYCIPQNINITFHAAKRLDMRGILLKDVIQCIMNGEIIEQYPEDYPYPSCLIMGCIIDNKILHVVIGFHEPELYLITAYYPDPVKWDKDFKIRKEHIK